MNFDARITAAENSAEVPWIADGPTVAAMHPYEGGDEYVGDAESYLREGLPHIPQHIRQRLLDYTTTEGSWLFANTIRSMPAFLMQCLRVITSRYVGSLLFRNFGPGVHTIMVKAPQGTGKTHSVANLVHDNRVLYPTVLFITSRRCVHYQLLHALRQRGVAAASYLDTPCMREGTVSVCQMESLPRFLQVPLNSNQTHFDETRSDMDNVMHAIDNAWRSAAPPPIDLLVIDEADAACKHLYSPTLLRHGGSAVRSTFMSLVRTSRRMIVMDADFNDSTIDFLLCTRQSTPTPTRDDMAKYAFMWLINHPPQKTVTNVIAAVKFHRLIVDAVLEGKNVVIGADSKIKAEAYYQHLCALFEENGIEDEILLYTADTDDATKQAMGSCNDIWVHYRVVIHSPTITYGLDFNTLHFDLQFYLFGMNTISPAHAFQMLGRIRQTREMRVYLHFYRTNSRRPNGHGIMAMKDRAPILQTYQVNAIRSALERDYRINPNLLRDEGNPVHSHFGFAPAPGSHMSHVAVDPVMKRLYAAKITEEYAAKYHFVYDIRHACYMSGYAWIDDMDEQDDNTAWSELLSQCDSQTQLDTLSDALSRTAGMEDTTYEEVSRKRIRTEEESTGVQSYEMMRLIGWRPTTGAFEVDQSVLQTLGFTGPGRVQHFLNFYDMFEAGADQVGNGLFTDVQGNAIHNIKRRLIFTLLDTFGFVSMFHSGTVPCKTDNMTLAELRMKGRVQELRLLRSARTWWRNFLHGENGFPSAMVAFNMPDAVTPTTVHDFTLLVNRIVDPYLRTRIRVKIRTNHITFRLGVQRMKLYVECATARNARYGDGVGANDLLRMQDNAVDAYGPWEFKHTAYSGVASPWDVTAPVAVDDADAAAAAAETL